MAEQKTYKWVKVAEDFELPTLVEHGRATTLEVGGHKVCFTRFDDGFYATSNRCPHAGGSLGDGWCDGDHQVVCPLHRIKFDVRTGKNTTGEGYNVRTYPLKLEKDGLYIGFEEKKWWQFW